MSLYWNSLSPISQSCPFFLALDQSAILFTTIHESIWFCFCFLSSYKVDNQMISLTLYLLRGFPLITAFQGQPWMELSTNSAAFLAYTHILSWPIHCLSSAFFFLLQLIVSGYELQRRHWRNSVKWIDSLGTCLGSLLVSSGPVQPQSQMNCFCFIIECYWACLILWCGGLTMDFSGCMFTWCLKIR